MLSKKRGLSVIVFMVAVAVISMLALNVNVHASNAAKIKSVTLKVGKKTVTKKTITLTAGKNTSLKVVVKPAKAKKSIAFKSAKPSVAKVNSKGKITAKNAGTSKITVTVRGKNGKKKTAYVTVKVTPKTIAVDSVTARISKSQLIVDETAWITAEVLPGNATDKTLTYSSSNQNVASVDQSGKVTAKGAGTAVITVRTSNGKYASVQVSVKDKTIDVISVTVDISPSAGILKGNTAQIKAEVFPANATDKSLTYTSSDETVATVDSSGKVTAKEIGTATIKATANGKSGKIVVTVLEKYNVDVEEHRVTDGDDSIYGKIYTPTEEGTWPAVIMCHGYNGVGTDFATECTYFAENGYIAYAFDFCGGSTRSQSSGQTTDMTIFTEKENLIAVFNDIKELSNVDSDYMFLHGGSQGGFVASLAAEELADEVKGLMLYFPAYNIPYDWAEMYPDVDKIPEVIPSWMGMDLGKEFAVSIHDYMTFDHIGSYSKNVLILYGEKDTVVKRSYMDEAKELYENCELILYPDEGHGFSPAGVDKAKKELLQFMKNQ